MKFTSSALLALTVGASLSSFSEAFAVTPGSRALRRLNDKKPSFVTRAAASSRMAPVAPPPQLSMSYTVAIVGATGAVGKEIIQCLESRNFPVEKLRILGSERSAGSEIKTGKYGAVDVELFSVEAARECDVVFLAVSGEFAEEHAEAIAAGDGGAVVIDNSSAFRYNPDIPLVVPEINGECTKGNKLIANPNCTTAIGLMAIWPLHKAFKLKKIIMSTYQASSGAGQPGMDELQDGTKKVLMEGGVADNKIFAHPLAFNVIPQIDKFMDNGYTKEEMKVTWESRKICGLDEDFPISCSAVRIPTIRAHSEVIVVETEKPIDIKLARKVLNEAPGIKLVDNPEKLEYPMPLTATGKEDVEVGRIRKSLVFDNGLEFFVSGDQLLRGAALNAVLVAEEMASNGALEEFAKAAA